ncbi:hypothetical protein BV898_12036 [Hypsibius exemplaris]|uniref:G-protein coupled receptors family 1 profile domain-containing protein n=1 Tax=Hypsibius exemplaris TaxID=2072580 RepID=A0A1W0WET0_HYPEX|nr:hypothetical protein BV898_12036 [Hypsibius exemplaris]
MLNETVFPLNFTNITAVNSNLSSTICKWPGTSHQWFHINALGLSPPLLTVLCDVLNLIVFRAWQKKEPYVLFHILLAVSSLLYGGLTALIPLGRILRPARPIQWLQEIGFAGPLVVHFCCFLTATVISADRWLSVEFPRFYRDQASKQKVMAVIVGICGVTVVATVPGAVTWHSCTTFYCFRAPIYRCKDHGPDWHTVIKDPILLLLLFVFQMRIVMIAVQMALRRRRSAVISCNVASIATSAGGAAPPSGPAVTALVWRSLRPGMAVVVASLISNVPHFVVTCLKMTGLGVLDGDISFLFLF